MITYLLPAAILFLGAIVQGAVGFAYGLVSISLLILLGMPLPMAMVAVGVSVLFQTLWVGWKYREHAPWKAIAVPLLVAFVGIVTGVLVLRIISDLDPVYIKATVGIVLVIVLLLQTCLRVKPRESLAAAWGWLAYGTGGFLCGLVGMGGPPVVLWVTAHDWPAVRIRVALWISMCAFVPMQTAMIFARFGWETTWTGIQYGLTALPLVFLGTWIGTRLGDRFSNKVLRKTIYALLWVIAAINLITPFA